MNGNSLNGSVAIAPLCDPECAAVKSSGSLLGVASLNGTAPDPEVPAIRPRRRFTQAYKQRIVHEAAGCAGSGEIGALLRREGLYSSHLANWRKQLAAAPKRRGRKPTDAALAAQVEANRKLQVKYRGLERRLARAEAIIDIQKKVSELLGIPLSPTESDESA